jgi:6-phosphogluconate dehydrogenase
MQHQLGVIGLSTMGGNLARNAARNGARVAVFNRTYEKTEEFIAAHGKEGDFVQCKTYADMVKALAAPRAILIMVKAGKPVDDVIAELKPLLSKDDILIDGGNSHYPDTARRCKELSADGIAFIGMGVSGGEEGALNGPSMMPGGDKEAFEHVRPLLEKMAADDGDGGKCVAYMGPGGAGHFVKMVHNGIEYGIMQLIAESYDLLKNEAMADNAELAEIFRHWNEGDDLKSFLVEITARVFRTKDPETGGHLLDVIKDAAGQKGTGKWTTEAAFLYGVPVPTITAAVDARILSGDLHGRAAAGEGVPVFLHDAHDRPKEIHSWARSALSCGVICAYEQGFDLLRKAGDAEGWELDLSEIARVWRGGCIIRAELLKLFQWAYGNDASLRDTARHLFLERFDAKVQIEWRRGVALGMHRGIPVPAMASSLSYFDAYRRERLPQNLIQAQRDLFGAHTYERVDKAGVFHSEWAS